MHISHPAHTHTLCAGWIVGDPEKYALPKKKKNNITRFSTLFRKKKLYLDLVSAYSR